MPPVCTCELNERGPSQEWFYLRLSGLALTHQGGNNMAKALTKKERKIRQIDARINSLHIQKIMKQISFKYIKGEFDELIALKKKTLAEK